MTKVTALPVSNVINVDINLQTLAASRRGFGTLLVITSEDVIDPLERLRYYSTLDGIAGDFGTGSGVYKAASLYFGHSAKPKQMAVGRMLDEPCPAYLKGGTLPDKDLDPASWASIVDGAFSLSLSGQTITVSGIDFTGVTNLNAAAERIHAAAQEQGVTCTFEGDHFLLRTLATGASVSLGYAFAPIVEDEEGTGQDGGDTGQTDPEQNSPGPDAFGLAAGTAFTDISAKLGCTAALALPLVPGADQESPLQAVVELANQAGDWYGLMFAEPISDQDVLEVAGYVEASGKSRIYGQTITDNRVVDVTVTTDLASRLKERGYNRTFTQYSKNPHAVASIFGRAFTVNFNGSKTTITLKFKQQPGVTCERLTVNQAKALQDKNCNMFVAYDNDTAIVQEGIMASGAYFDEMHGLDWLQNAVQNECWNAHYQSATKIPQTDEGSNTISAVIKGVFNEAVRNGLIAPGQWNGDPFGQLQTGDYLDTGYYIYCEPMASQPQSEREQRKCPPHQTAIKLAGAIHFNDISINVNR